VSLRNEGDRRAEIAYGSHPRIRGTGGMERALRLLLDWGFGSQDLHTVAWWANRGNWASRKLAWRLGFAVDASLRAWLPQRGELLDAWGGTLVAGDPRLPRHRWVDAPTIESPRLSLRLRPVRAADVDRIVEACSDVDTRRWLGEIPQPYRRDLAEAYRLACDERMSTGDAMYVAAAARDDDRMLALVGLSDLHPALRSAGLGYWCHPAERGQGVATEAARLVLRHALLPEDEGGLGLTRVSARAATANTASISVLERVGMRRVGIARRGSLTATGLEDATLYEVVDGSMV
jgi:RimJ/RimL family protein N-acetyltransferase